MNATRIDDDAPLESFDSGENMEVYFDFEHSEFPNREVKRVNVDFPCGWLRRSIVRRLALESTAKRSSRCESPSVLTMGVQSGLPRALPQSSLLSIVARLSSVDCDDAILAELVLNDVLDPGLVLS